MSMSDGVSPSPKGGGGGADSAPQNLPLWKSCSCLHKINILTAQIWFSSCANSLTTRTCCAEPHARQGVGLVTTRQRCLQRRTDAIDVRRRAGRRRLPWWRPVAPAVAMVAGRSAAREPDSARPSHVMCSRYGVRMTCQYIGKSFTRSYIAYIPEDVFIWPVW